MHVMLTKVSFSRVGVGDAMATLSSAKEYNSARRVLEISNTSSAAGLYKKCCYLKG